MTRNKEVVTLALEYTIYIFTITMTKYYDNNYLKSFNIINNKIELKQKLKKRESKIKTHLVNPNFEVVYRIIQTQM